jgi:hypothetical protein
LPAVAIFEELHNFEEGQPQACISRPVFELLVDLLGVELDEIRSIIRERRLEDEKESEEFVRQPSRIVLGMETRSAFGWQRIFPPDTTLDVAKALASERSRVGPCVVRLYFDGSVHYFLDGAPTETRPLVGFSVYPFSREMSGAPVDDGWG